MTWYEQLPPDQQTKIDAATVSADYQTYPAVAAARNYAGADAPAAFIYWLASADRTCQRQYGISIHDLADYRWRDAYDDGMSPRETVRDAMAAEGLDLFL